MNGPEPGLDAVPRPLAFGIFEFNPASLELKRNGYPVRLQELPARLLNALLRRPGELVTREQLRVELWPSNTFVQFDAGLNTAMNKVRLALRDSADNPNFIETVPRTGYRFIAPVRVVGEPVAAAVPAAPAKSPTPIPARLRPRRKLLWTALAAAALGVSAVFILSLRPLARSHSGLTTRFAIDLPPGQEFHFYSGRQIAISPNGSTVAWIAADAGIKQIYVRNLKETAFRTLAGTGLASSLCFSPGGDWLVYVNESGELRKVSVDGRWNVKLLYLSRRSLDATMTWASDGWIYFSAAHYPPSTESESRSVFRIRQGGGPAEAVMPGPQPVGAWYPRQLLPRGLLLAIDYAPSDQAVSILLAADRNVRQLIGHAAGGQYLPTGHLIFDQSGNLMAVPFDPDRLQMKGQPVVVIPDVAQDRYAGLQDDVSDTGTLVYFRGSVVHPRRPVWVDLEGRVTPTSLPVGRYRLLDLAPDGHTLLLTRFDTGEHWATGTYNLDTADWKEILSGDSPGTGGIWSPDGRSVAITARYQGERMDTLYLKTLDMDGGERPLLSDAYSGKYAQSWSKAANAILYTEGYYQRTKRDIYVLPLSGGPPQCIACTPEDDVYPSFSPDGKWITYTSGVSGRFEIYVQRYPGPAAPIRISEDGGRNSLWAPSGRELYYRNNSEVRAVAFDPVTGRAGKTRTLFSGKYDSGGTMWNRDFAVSPDGSRFLMLKLEDDPPDYRRIQVVLNWFDELRRLSPN